MIKMRMEEKKKTEERNPLRFPFFGMADESEMELEDGEAPDWPYSFFISYVAGRYWNSLARRYPRARETPFIHLDSIFFDACREASSCRCGMTPEGFLPVNTCFQFYLERRMKWKSEKDEGDVYAEQ